MPCVNDHAEFLSMAADWATEQIADLLAETGVKITPQLAPINNGHSHHHHHH